MIVWARKPLGLAVACCLVLALASMLDGQPKIVTWHNDNARTGHNLSETILTPANVRPASFGKLFVLAVDGKVDAQPLYVPALSIPGQGTHNVLYVETEHDSADAFDADNGALLKQLSLIGSGETTSDDRGCAQVTPEIGITATPVIDPAMGPHGTIYVVAMTKDQSGNYHQRLHALDLTTLAEEFSGPVEIAANVSRKPRRRKEKLRGYVSDVLTFAARGSRGAAAAERRGVHQLDVTLRCRPVHELGHRL